MMKRIIVHFLILVRKACGLGSVRRRMQKNNHEQLELAKKILASVDALNETNQKSLRIIQARMEEIVNNIDIVLKTISSSSRDIDKNLSGFRSNVDMAMVDCSGKMEALVKTLEFASSKEDVSALSEQLLQTRRSIEQIINDLKAIDKAQSLILVNQVMDLADNFIQADDRERD